MRHTNTNAIPRPAQQLRTTAPLRLVVRCGECGHPHQVPILGGHPDASQCPSCGDLLPLAQMAAQAAA